VRILPLKKNCRVLVIAEPSTRSIINTLSTSKVDVISYLKEINNPVPLDGAVSGRTAADVQRLITALPGHLRRDVYDPDFLAAQFEPLGRYMM
jgi:hypothetical protein